MAKKETQIVVSQVAVTQNQMAMMTQPTPPQFIKTKPGRGGKQVKFIEGGYVTNQLNRIFGPLNWSFKITDRGFEPRKIDKNSDGEVWVYGELTIHDHKRGFAVTKGQSGQHPVHANVPMGDAYKAAGTDALKKCASLFGIGLDVYWGMLDDADGQPAPRKEVAAKSKDKPAKPFEIAKLFIAQNDDKVVLGNMVQRINDTDALTLAEKQQLKKMIFAKIGLKYEEGTLI